MAIVAMAASGAAAVAQEDVPAPPERPVVPAIVFFPGSAGTGEAGDNREGPVLTIYDSQSCDARIAGECALVTFTCADERSRGLGITVDAIETDQVMKWLEAEGDSADGMQLDIRGLTAGSSPVIGEISRSDYGAGWKVTFYAPFETEPPLKLDGDTLVVNAMPRQVSLDLTDANRSALEQFTELCARE